MVIDHEDFQLPSIILFEQRPDCIAHDIHLIACGHYDRNTRGIITWRAEASRRSRGSPKTTPGSNQVEPYEARQPADPSCDHILVSIRLTTRELVILNES
jgi:hypothetical protein